MLPLRRVRCQTTRNQGSLDRHIGGACIHWIAVQSRGAPRLAVQAAQPAPAWWVRSSNPSEGIASLSLDAAIGFSSRVQPFPERSSQLLRADGSKGRDRFGLHFAEVA